MYVCTYYFVLYIRTCMCMYVYMYVCTYVRMYVCISVHTFVRMYVCTYVCTYSMCVHMDMFVISELAKLLLFQTSFRDTVEPPIVDFPT